MHCSGRVADHCTMNIDWARSIEWARSSDPMILLAAGVVWLLVSALVGYAIGRRKCRPMLGVVLGVFLTLPGLLAVSLLPQKEPTYY
jgi:hypothetical protein